MRTALVLAAVLALRLSPARAAGPVEARAQAPANPLRVVGALNGQVNQSFGTRANPALMAGALGTRIADLRARAAANPALTEELQAEVLAAELLAEALKSPEAAERVAALLATAGDAGVQVAGRLTSLAKPFHADPIRLVSFSRSLQARDAELAKELSAGSLDALQARFAQSYDKSSSAGSASASAAVQAGAASGVAAGSSRLAPAGSVLLRNGAQVPADAALDIYAALRTMEAVDPVSLHQLNGNVGARGFADADRMSQYPVLKKYPESVVRAVVASAVVSANGKLRVQTPAAPAADGARVPIPDFEPTAQRPAAAAQARRLPPGSRVARDLALVMAGLVAVSLGAFLLGMPRAALAAALAVLPLGALTVAGLANPAGIAFARLFAPANLVLAMAVLVAVALGAFFLSQPSVTVGSIALVLVLGLFTVFSLARQARESEAIGKALSTAAPAPAAAAKKAAPGLADAAQAANLAGADLARNVNTAANTAARLGAVNYTSLGDGVIFLVSQPPSLDGDLQLGAHDVYESTEKALSPAARAGLIKAMAAAARATTGRAERVDAAEGTFVLRTAGETTGALGRSVAAALEAGKAEAAKRKASKPAASPAPAHDARAALKHLDETAAAANKAGADLRRNLITEPSALAEVGERVYFLATPELFVEVSEGPMSPGEARVAVKPLKDGAERRAKAALDTMGLTLLDSIGKVRADPKDGALLVPTAGLAPAALGEGLAKALKAAKLVFVRPSLKDVAQAANAAGAGLRENLVTRESAVLEVGRTVYFVAQGDWFIEVSQGPVSYGALRIAVKNTAAQDPSPAAVKAIIDAMGLAIADVTTDLRTDAPRGTVVVETDGLDAQAAGKLLAAALKAGETAMAR